MSWPWKRLRVEDATGRAVNAQQTLTLELLFSAVTRKLFECSPRHAAPRRRLNFAAHSLCSRSSGPIESTRFTGLLIQLQDPEILSVIELLWTEVAILNEARRVSAAKYFSGTVFAV